MHAGASRMMKKPDQKVTRGRRQARNETVWGELRNDASLRALPVP
jgi:hypothetical protein